MAFKLDDNKDLVAEINVTPFVDVMLVLLVIFMVTSPMLFNGINLQLPQTKEVNSINISSSQIVLSYTKSGKLFLGEERVFKEDLLEQIRKEFKDNKTDIIYIRADYSMKYGNIAKLMSFLKRGGIQNISLVTEVDNEK